MIVSSLKLTNTFEVDMDFKTLSPAYPTSLGVIFAARSDWNLQPWLLWLGWILLILALGLNVPCLCAVRG